MNNKYNPISREQSQLNNEFGNYNTVFKEQKSIIEPRTFINNSTTLDNNLENIIKSENIYEYKININTNDRDITVYPSIYNFKVLFGISTVMPSINRIYKNIKYVVIESVILPRTMSIDISSGTPATYVINPATTYD